MHSNLGFVRKNRHHSIDEGAYRKRRVLGIDYFQSRIGFDGASLTAYRFPCQVSEKEGPDFVLVHGIGVSARSYAPTAALLAQKGEVHLLDLAGYGNSPRPDRNVSIADHAELVALYLQEKQLDHPVVVGHSMGAQVITALAAHYPHLVDHIVLIAPVMTPDARTLLRAARLLLKDGLREPPIVAMLSFNDYLFRAGIPYMVEQTPHLLNARIEEQLGEITAKTLVICGKRDPVVPLAWGEEIANALENGWFAVVPGPHGAMFGAPEAISRLIDEHAHR